MYTTQAIVIHVIVLFHPGSVAIKLSCVNFVLTVWILYFDKEYKLNSFVICLLFNNILSVTYMKAYNMFMMYCLSVIRARIKDLEGQGHFQKGHFG